MNTISIIAGGVGVAGTGSRLLPELIGVPNKDGIRSHCWSSAIGMLKVDRMEAFQEIQDSDLPNEVIGSIIVTQGDAGSVNMMELHGVMFFQPLEGMKWNQQLEAFKSNPSNFEVVPVFRLEDGGDYAFFARRAVKKTLDGRKTR